MNSKEVRIKVAIDTVLGDMKGTIDKLDDGLKKGVTKIDIGKGIGASLTKSIEKFRSEYENLSKLTDGNAIKFGDSKEAIQSGERLIKLYKEIHSQTGRLQNLSGIDLKKIFPDAFDSRVSALQSQMQSLQNIFLQIGEKELKLKIADEELQASRTQLKELSDSLIDTTAKQQAFNKAQAEAAAAKLDLEAQEQSAREAGQAFDSAKQALEELRESFRQQINLNLGKIDTEIKGLEESLEELRKKKAQLEASGDTKGAAAIGKQITSTESTIKTKTAERKKISTAASKIQTADPKKLAEFATATTSDITAQTAALEKAQLAYGNYTAAQQAADAAAGQAALARKEHTDAMGREQDALQDLQAAEKTNTNTTKQIESVTKKIEEQENAVTTLTTQIEGLKTKLSTKGAADLKELIPDFSEESLKTQEGVDGIIRKLQELDDQRAEQLISELQKIDTDADEVASSVDQMRKKIEQVDDGAKDIRQTGQEIQNLKNQVLQFFSLTNTVQLFRRAVTQALNTVKELDKTMTEAAVVTDFSIGDMWEKIPQYSENAQKLGVSINGMYQATTLYYQQGLKNQEAMALGIETMKMGKIAAMDSTEATKAMTAALRGFNMELNETSATRVNDVYSQLAAVTAADTNQIATAMEKTASIAASANMEFETTAALLAQIIETTQEAPETAGTAMKTIIARFAEVKSLREQGMSSGKDEEGEGIDVNKIQTALRSVGISMEGFFNGTEGLDSILLKLSEKWGTLDFETQRYIATMAAGSRQQSRFIAMMSDYSRTTELVGEAQNSAGASQKQFEKTQESLETSLARLKNAWDEFLMGLANNEILKAGVDGLTKILETINKTTEALSGGNGLIKAAISLGGVLATLKMGKTILGGTAVGGAVGGLMSKLTGGGKGEDGQSTGKGGRFGLPEGANVPGGWSKEGWKKGYDAKRAELKANRPTLKERFTKEGTVQKKDVSAALGKMEMDLDDQDMSTRATGIRALNEQLADGQITVEEAEQGYLKLGGSVEDLNVSAKGTVPNFDAMGQAASTAGMAMMAAGAATSLLASAFESWGMEEEAEAMQTLSGVLMTLGPILMGIGSFLPVLTTLTAAQAAATWAALWPILLIVAAVAALIAIWVLCAKAAKEASDEAKLEKLNEQVEQLGEAVDEARDKFEKLTEAKNELDEMSQKLKGLTKGTREWKQALFETNQKVLDLLNSYPQLAQYVERGEYGELAIDEAGWDQILTAQQESIVSASTARTATQQQAAELQLKIDTEKILSEAYGKIQGSSYAKAYKYSNEDYYEEAYSNTIQQNLDYGNGSDATYSKYTVDENGYVDWTTHDVMGGLSTEQYMEFASKAAEKGLTMGGYSSKGEFEALYNELGYSGQFDDLWESMSDAGDAFDDVANAAYSVALAEEARIKAVAASVAQSSKTVSESEDFGQAAVDFSTQLYENYADKVTSQANQHSYDTGKNATTSTESNKKLIAEYAKTQNMTEDEVRAKIEDKSLSYASMASVVGAAEVNEQMVKDMEGIVSSMEKLTKSMNKSQKKQISGLMSEKGLGLTAVGVKEISAYGSVAEYMQKVGIGAEQAAAMGLTLGELTEKLTENFNNAQKALDDAYFSYSTYGLGMQLKSDIENLNESFQKLGAATELTISQTKALAQALAQVEINGGSSTQATQLFSELVSDLSGEKLSTAMNLLASTNWSSQSAIHSTINALRDLGAGIDQNLVQKVMDATNAFSDLSIGALQDQFSQQKSTRDMVLDKVNSGEKVFTAEELSQLTQYGYSKDDFVMSDWGEYVYMGDTNDILKKINEDSSAILKSLIEDSKEKVEKGNKIKEFEYNKTKNGDQQAAAETWQAIQDGKGYAKREGYVQTAVDKYLNGEAGAGTGTFTGTVAGRENVKMSEYLSMNGNLDFDTQWESDWKEVAGKIGYSSEVAKGLTPQEREQLWRTLMENYAADELTNSRNGKLLDTAAVSAYRYTDVGLGAEIDDDAMRNLAKQWGVDENEYIDLTGDALRNFLITYYNNYYGENGKTLEQNVKDDEENTKQAMEIDAMRDIGKNDYWSVTDDSKLEARQKVLEGYIASEQGLTIAVEHVKEQLDSEANSFISNTGRVQNLVAANHKAAKGMDVLHEALNDQLDAFKIGNKNSQQYRVALDRVTAAAKQAFGEGITSDFVHEHRKWFEDLAKGGDVAQTAYEKISQELASKYLKSINKASLATEALNAAMMGIPSNLEVGVAFDPTQAINNLMALGMSAAEAATYLENLGYEVELETQTMWKDPLTGLLSPDKIPGGIKIETIISAGAIKKDAAGTGIASSSYEGKEHENPYDKYFNDLEEINDLLRERERLELRYQRLVRRGIQSVSEVRKSQQDQLASLREENDMQRAMIANRTGQIKDSMNKSGVSKYAKVETNEYGDKSIRIDWNEIDKVYKSGNEKEIEKIEKFMDENQEWLDDIYDREGTIQENLDKEYEILQQGMDEYLSIEEQIKSAIEASAQKEIDRLSAIDQSINDTNSKLLESMQAQIDEQRQARENEKTEEELSDKQRRLAYLQQDTSGANALEIMQLQKELDEGQESYTDQLIDQKISELQKQNDKAAEQRQQQIDILNAQLQHYMNSGEVWQRVNELLDGAIQADGTIAADSELMTLLKEANNYDAMSEIGQMQWYKDLINTIAIGFNWLNGEGAMSSMWEGKEIEFTTADGTIVKGVVGADGKVTAKDGQVYGNVRWNGGNNFSTDESTKVKDPEIAPEKKEIRVGGRINAAGAKIYTWWGGEGKNQYFAKDPIYDVLDEKNGYLKTRWYKSKSDGVTGWFKKTDVTAYKTGGLADFTGPAWLDGTKSKPEYILNADQTKAFFTLVDVLSGLQTNTSKSSEKTGDNTYDIDINVESIGSDYDVEQLATTVKRLINEDARYRNNNAINLTR